jgi:hypothetical protein
MHIVTFLVRAACNSVQEPATLSNNLSTTFDQEISLLDAKHMFQSSKYYLDWSSPTRHEVDPDVQSFTAATGGSCHYLGAKKEHMGLCSTILRPEADPRSDQFYCTSR